MSKYTRYGVEDLVPMIEALEGRFGKLDGEGGK